VKAGYPRVAERFVCKPVNTDSH